MQSFNLNTAQGCRGCMNSMSGENDFLVSMIRYRKWACYKSLFWLVLILFLFSCWVPLDVLEVVIAKGVH